MSYVLKRKFYKKGYINNFTTVGTPTFDGSVVSGFSSANYIKTFGIPNDVSSFEFGVKFTTGTTIKKQQGIFANSETNIYTPQLIIDDTGYLEGLTPTKVGTWGSEINSPYVLEANTTYWAKYGWDGAECYLDVSLDGDVYERVGTVTHSSIGWTEVLGIGIDTTSHPFLGSIDLSECHIKINNELWWTPYKRCKYDYNFTIAGSLGISAREETCTFNKFSSANYVTLPENFDVSDGSTWEMVYKIRTGDNITTGQSICGHTGSGNADPVNPCIKSSKFQLTTSKSSSSNIFSDVYGTATLEANTDYFVKIVFDGSAYILSYSTDGETFIEDIRKESTTPIWASNLAIGRQQGADSEYPWLGSIDLTQSYIKINGELWWSCFKKTEEVAFKEDGTLEDFDFFDYKNYFLKANSKSYLLQIPPFSYTFTINATPENAVVLINGEVRGSLKAVEGTEITWQVSLDGYKTQRGTLTLSEDTTIDVVLRELQNYTFTINPTPSDATVTINGEVTNSVTVLEDSEVSYEVSLEGYVTQSGSVVVNEDTVLDVVLEEELLLECSEISGYYSLVDTELYKAVFHPTYENNAIEYMLCFPNSDSYYIASNERTSFEINSYTDEVVSVVYQKANINLNAYEEFVLSGITFKTFKGSGSYTSGNTKYLYYLELAFPSGFVLGKSAFLNKLHTTSLDDSKSVISSVSETTYARGDGWFSCTILRSGLKVNVLTGDLYE
ncbi:MAG: hypothetical protein IJV75_00240 [Alphaproteobacteria bacterium]|nr:hypothetical protein [Alphaproteobacteria bacterium]